MNIYFIPYDPRNHYTTLIIDYLEKNGALVLNKGICNKYKTIIRSLWEVPAKHVKVIHVNWIETCASLGPIKGKIFGFLVLKWVDLMRLYGAKIVWTVHNKTSHNDSKNKSNTKVFYIKMLKRTDMIMVHCQETTDSLINDYGVSKNKIFNVPHGAYDDEIAKPIDWKYKDKVNEKKFILLTFGNIVPYKNIPLLIEALNEMQIDGIQLLIAGKARDEKLENKISNKLINTDYIFDNRFVPDEEMKSLFSLSDCVVLPYEKESMYNSGVAVMAFSKSLPVIVSNFGAIKEISDRNFVFEYDFENNKENKEHLKKRIEYVYGIANDNPELYSEIRKQAYKYAHEEISWANICKIIYQKYEELLSRK